MSEPRSTNPSAPSKSPRARKRSKGKPDVAPTYPEAPDGESATTTPAAAIAPALSRIDRESMIRAAAYLRAQQRNFEPGHALEDWLAAEAQVDAALLESGLRS